MPNGYPEEKARIWRASRLWGAVWQVGDWALYVGLLLSVLIPALVLKRAFVRFEGWSALLRSAGLAMVALVGCFAAGVLVKLILQGLAERCAGVDFDSDPPTG